MMATFEEVRVKFPQYNDIPDVQLADALHKKFYADIPKQQFYQQIGLPTERMIPGNENMITLPKKEPSLKDRLLGVVETPAIIAGEIGKMIATPLASMYGQAVGGYGTPQGRAAGQAAAQEMSGQFYQPRTETGPDIVSAMGKALGALPPTLGSTGSTLQAVTGPAAGQTRALLQRGATITTENPNVRKMAALLKPQEPQMPGMGAASTNEALLRAERAQTQNIPLTKGEQLKDFGQLQFESDIVKEKPELAKALLQFKEGQKSQILNRFDQLAEETGTREVPYMSNFRNVGRVVDKNLVKQFEDKKQLVDTAYQAARNAGETKQVVSTAPLEQWLETNAGKAISVPEINSIKADLNTLKKVKNGQVTIDDLEELYKSAGQLGEPGKASGLFMKEVKGVINNMTEGAGGDLYRAARKQRAELGKDFENTYRVAKLLGTRGGYADRAVALDDVFGHVVLDGSLEEMRTVTKLLKKGGPEGQQAYAELQGQTIQYLKDQLQKNASGDLSFAKLKTAIDTLDKEDKLAYMFGKQGRQTLIDVKDAVADALVKPPGTVNYSNTGNVVIRGLDKLAKLNFPLAKTASEFAENQQVKKQVQESINYNALVDALTK